MAQPREVHDSTNQEDQDSNTAPVAEGNGGRKATPYFVVSNDISKPDESKPLSRRSDEKSKELLSEITRTLLFLKLLIIILVLSGIILVVVTNW